MKTRLPIYGMHCKSCELLIESKLSQIAWIEVKYISQNKNFIDVEVKNESDLEVIKQTIENLWYQVHKKQNNTFFDWIVILLLFVIFWILYFLLKDIKIFENALLAHNLSLLLIIWIWFIASLSSCLAVTWGIVLGFSQYANTQNTLFSHLKTQFNFHLGRITWFMLWGWILGSLGGYFGSLGNLNTFLLFLAGIFLVYLWLHMLHIIPSISQLWIGMPKIFGKKILNVKNPAFAPFVWALTFFLPCWFTQSMQVYAASSGSFMSGALIMGAFALGTMPVLFLLWFGSSYFKDKNFHYLSKVMGVLVVYFWVILLYGLSNLISFWGNPPLSQANLENIIFEQKTVYHNGWSLEEKEIFLTAGNNYKLNIIPKKNGTGCMTTLTIPGIDNTTHNIIQAIPIGIHIIDAKPGKYNIVCSSMGMKQGEIIIQ